MFQYPLSGLVTLFAVFVYFWMATQVGKARQAHSIMAPVQDGPEDFLRVLRVHENTLEMLALFLPALWLCALTISDFWAALIGGIFPISRIIYARGYYQAADKRGRGFMIGFLATLALLIGASLGLIHTAYAIYS
jgi:glutathione S-transferase